MIRLPSIHNIQRLGVQFIADALLIRSGRGYNKKQRLLTGIAGAFGHNVIEFPVRLGMDFIKDETGNIQSVFRTCLSGKHLIEPGIPVIDDPLGGRCNLRPL